MLSHRPYAPGRRTGRFNSPPRPKRVGQETRHPAPTFPQTGPEFTPDLSLLICKTGNSGVERERDLRGIALGKAVGALWGTSLLPELSGQVLSIYPYTRLSVHLPVHPLCHVFLSMQSGQAPCQLEAVEDHGLGVLTSWSLVSLGGTLHRE